MSSSSLSSLERTDALSLDFLEADPAPTFVVKVGNGAGAVAFELLFCNAAFRNERGLRGGVLADERAAMLFRAWAQAGDYCKSRWEFGGCVWSARVAGVDGDWKVVRAVEVGLGEQPFRDQNGRNTDVPIGTGRRLIKRQSTGCLLEKVSQSLAVPLQSLPRVNWGSIQRMMERSDVGVFEYDPSGKLIHANEAWYSLRYIYMHIIVKKYSPRHKLPSQGPISAHRLLIHGSRLSRRPSPRHVGVEYTIAGPPSHIRDEMEAASGFV